MNKKILLGFCLILLSSFVMGLDLNNWDTSCLNFSIDVNTGEYYQDSNGTYQFCPILDYNQAILQVINLTANNNQLNNELNDLNTQYAGFEETKAYCTALISMDKNRLDLCSTIYTELDNQNTKLDQINTTTIEIKETVNTTKEKATNTENLITAQNTKIVDESAKTREALSGVETKINSFENQQNLLSNNLLTQMGTNQIILIIGVIIIIGIITLFVFLIMKHSKNERQDFFIAYDQRTKNATNYMTTTMHATAKLVEQIKESIEGTKPKTIEQKTKPKGRPKKTPLEQIKEETIKPTKPEKPKGFDKFIEQNTVNSENKN